MSSHGKKKIAPILITIIMLAYFALYFGYLVWSVPSAAVRVLLVIIPLLLGGGMIFVCVQRIREIDGGEEDDLSQY